MPTLRDILAALAGRPDVAGAMVVSDEGLVIETALATNADAESIAAHGATALRALGGLTKALGYQPCHQVLVDGPSGAVVMQALPSGASLLVLAEPDGDLAELLYELRRHGPAIADQV
jgi:predicted regulator of Ras-like GTPase activity (Roadblock/LC7/MglB family)